MNPNATLTPDSRAKWEAIFNSLLAQNGDESLARRAANARTKPSPGVISQALRERLANAQVR